MKLQCDVRNEVLVRGVASAPVPGYVSPGSDLGRNLQRSAPDLAAVTC